MKIIWIFLVIVIAVNSLNIEEKKVNVAKELQSDKAELFSNSVERRQRYPGYGYGGRYNGYGNRYNGYGGRYNGYGNRYNGYGGPYGGSYGSYGNNYGQYNPYYYGTTVGFPLSLFTTQPPLPFPFYYFTTPPPFPFNLFGKKK